MIMMMMMMSNKQTKNKKNGIWLFSNLQEITMTTVHSKHTRHSTFLIAGGGGSCTFHAGIFRHACSALKFSALIFPSCIFSPPSCNTKFSQECKCHTVLACSCSTARRSQNGRNLLRFRPENFPVTTESFQVSRYPVSQWPRIRRTRRPGQFGGN